MVAVLSCCVSTQSFSQDTVLLPSAGRQFLVNYLQAARLEAEAAHVESQAAAAAAAIIGQTTVQDYPLADRTAHVTVTVRQAAAANLSTATAAAGTATVGDQHDQACRADVARLSAAVLLAAADVGRLQLELEQQLKQVRMTHSVIHSAAFYQNKLYLCYIQSMTVLPNAVRLPSALPL